MSEGTDEHRNFDFLSEFDGQVGRLARQAETYVHSDPEACLFKLRLMVETMAKRLIEIQRPDLVSADLSAMLRGLQRDRMLSRKRADTMHLIRRDGNAAVHGVRVPSPTAMRRLRDAHGLATWFARVLRRGTKVEPGKFRPPRRPRRDDARRDAAIERAERLEAEIERRRERTREALLLFGDAFDRDRGVRQILSELEAFDRVAVAAGEPIVDAGSAGLIMAMELESLLTHPRLGLSSREAQAMAERQLSQVKAELDAREQAYAEERAAIAPDADD